MSQLTLLAQATTTGNKPTNGAETKTDVKKTDNRSETAGAGPGTGSGALGDGTPPNVVWGNSNPASTAPASDSIRPDPIVTGHSDSNAAGSGEPSNSHLTEPASHSFLTDKYVGLDAGYWIIIAVSLSLSSVAIYFWNLADKAESNLRASEAELADAKRSLKKAAGAQANQPSPLTRSAPAPAPAPQFKTPVEVERAVARLSSGLAGKLNIVNDVYRILQPHSAVVSRIPELDSRLQAAKRVLDSKDSPDKAAAAILAAEALLAAPELASEGLLRELLQDALRAQRRKGGVSLEESRVLAASLAAACATEFFVPEVGQPFDKNLHQAVGDSATSAFREPTIKRVVSGGLREPKTGHIGIRADVEIG